MVVEAKKKRRSESNKDLGTKKKRTVADSDAFLLSLGELATLLKTISKGESSNTPIAEARQKLQGLISEEEQLKTQIVSGLGRNHDSELLQFAKGTLKFGLLLKDISEKNAEEEAEARANAELTPQRKKKKANEEASEKDFHSLQVSALRALSVVSRIAFSASTKESNGTADTLLALTCGHSRFVAIMLDKDGAHSEVKAALAQLICSLIEVVSSKSASETSSALIPVLLSAYHATLSESDQWLLYILHVLEQKSGVSLAAYFPVVWGAKAAAKYSVSADKTASNTLWGRTKSSEILDLIDTDLMIETAVQFPIELQLKPSPPPTSSSVATSSVYDPRFFMPVLCQMCAAGAYVDRHWKLVERGALALAVASLSSRDAAMRAAGYLVLARLYAQLQRAKLTAEKQVWMHVVDMIRHGVRAAASSSSSSSSSSSFPMRLPSPTTVFVVRLCAVLRQPLHPMYRALSSFALAKPVLDVLRVPELLRLFHGREAVTADVERAFILEVLRDGIKDGRDFAVAAKDYVIKMLLAFHDCALASIEKKKHEQKVECPDIRQLVREVVLRMVSLPKPAKSLLCKNGLLFWLQANAGQATSSDELADYVAIASRAWNAVDDAEDRDSLRMDFELLVQTLVRLTEDANNAVVSEDNVKEINALKELISL